VVIDVGGEAEIEQMKLLLASRESWFRRVARECGQAVEWRQGVESPTARLVRECAAADLVVVASPHATVDLYRRPDVAEAMLRAGRPFLVVPEGVKALKAERIVVGWKDTREARRAVADALPFLVRASAVTIVEICEREEAASALSEVEEIRRYLEKHKVQSCHEFIARPERAIGRQLLSIAHQINADLIVLGAYGHTRLGEWLFGGATRELLAASDVCCLMSH
jgi:nucleotide-binding universal stress UspA family protein